jgi:hypothetical protein
MHDNPHPITLRTWVFATGVKNRHFTQVGAINAEYLRFPRTFRFRDNADFAARLASFPGADVTPQRATFVAHHTVTALPAHNSLTS